MMAPQILTQIYQSRPPPRGNEHYRNAVSDGACPSTSRYLLLHRYQRAVRLLAQGTVQPIQIDQAPFRKQDGLYRFKQDGYQDR